MSYCNYLYLNKNNKTLVHVNSCVDSPQDFCSTILPSTHYAPSTSWITTNPDDLEKEIMRLPESGTCTELIKTLNCVVKYPACSTDTQKLIPICQSQCPQINIQIARCSLDLVSSDFILVKRLLNSFGCYDPNSYYNFPSRYINIETNTTECLMLSKYNYN